MKKATRVVAFCLALLGSVGVSSARESGPLHSLMARLELGVPTNASPLHDKFRVADQCTDGCAIVRRQCVLVGNSRQYCNDEYDTCMNGC